MCFLALETLWSRTLHELTEYISTFANCSAPQTNLRALDSFMEAFLSLTVEMLRHSGRSSTAGGVQDCEIKITSSSTSGEKVELTCNSEERSTNLSDDWGDSGERNLMAVNCVLSCQQTVLAHLQSLVPPLQRSTSMFLLKKLLDVFVKAIECCAVPVDRTVQDVQLSMVHILRSQLMQSVVDSWIQTFGVTLVRSSLTKSESGLPVMEEGLAPVSSGDCGLLNTIVRKLLLLLLKCTAVQIHRKLLPCSTHVYLVP